MAKTCYLHIGSPKTGSTTLQAWCFRNKAALEARGVLYPGGHRRHNALLTAFHADAANLRFNRTGENLAEHGAGVALLAAEFAEVAASPAPRVIYSNENFFGKAGQLDLAGLHDLLRQHFDEIRVICYLRDPYKLLISRAQEQVKSGVRTYQAVVAAPPVLDMARLQDFIALFGRAALELRNFDAVVAGDSSLTGDFMNCIQPGISLEGLQETGTQNVGLSLEAALLVSGLNERHGLKGDWDGRHLRLGALRGIGSTRFGLPRAAVLAVRERLLAQYGHLQAAGLAFTPPDWQALPDPQPDWSPQVLEQIALAMNALAARRAKKQKGGGKGPRRGRHKGRAAQGS